MYSVTLGVALHVMGLVLVWIIPLEDSGIPYQLRAPVKPDNAHFPEPEIML